MSADVDFDAARVMAEIIEPPLPPRDGQHPSITLAQSAVYNLARAYLALAAVSRPAEARGEPDYLALTDRNGHILTTRKASEGAENILAQFPADEFPNHAPFTLVPLYAHPAPSGGEGDAQEIERVAAHTYAAKKQPGIPWEWLSEPRREFLREFVKAGARIAAPRPEPGEVSEAMVDDACAAYSGSSASGDAALLRPLVHPRGVPHLGRTAGAVPDVDPLAAPARPAPRAVQAGHRPLSRWSVDVRAKLVVVERVKVNLAGDEMDIPVHHSDPSCATCKWAEAEHTFSTREKGLACKKWPQADALMTPGAGYAHGESYLYVAPTFGCVQWEGK